MRLCTRGQFNSRCSIIDLQEWSIKPNYTAPFISVQRGDILDLLRKVSSLLLVAFASCAQRLEIWRKGAFWQIRQESLSGKPKQ